MKGTTLNFLSLKWAVGPPGESPFLNRQGEPREISLELGEIRGGGENQADRNEEGIICRDLKCRDEVYMYICCDGRRRGKVRERMGVTFAKPMWEGGGLGPLVRECGLASYVFKIEICFKKREEGGKETGGI